MSRSPIAHISFLLAAILLTGTACFAQKTGYNWIFGNHTGLSFLQDPPTQINSSALSTIEGSSSISDGDGKLLFYSNGVNVYNRENRLMANGDFLSGAPSSTSNSVIVALPNNDSLYYLFTVGAANDALKTFCYSVINMKAENGLGRVIEKNNVIEFDIFEKLAGVRHCNKRDVWLVVKRFGTDMYYSYLLTPAGVNLTPVVSTTGFTISGLETNAIGALKFSPDGKKLAAAHGGNTNILELMDFDNSNGAITNSIQLQPNNAVPGNGFRGVYGTEFSPNGKMLYVSSNNNLTEKAVVYQFDVTSGVTAGIMATKNVLSVRSDWYAGALQLGPDRRIYYCQWKDTALSVIESPDVYGSGANLVPDKIKLPELSESGLTSYIASDMASEYAAYNFRTTRSADCSDKNIHFNINYTADIDSVKWDFGDGDKSTLLAPVHLYAAIGSYDVSLMVYRTDCTGSHPVTLSRKITLGESITKLPGDVSMCDGEPLVLKPLTTADNYLWSTNAVSDSIIVTDDGLYWLETQTSGCVSRDTIIVTKKPRIKIFLGNDTTVCAEKPVVIGTGISGTSNYIWNTGSVSPTLTVSEPGSFWLKSEDVTNCLVSDTINVTYGNCDIYFPSAFTPNGDSRNETFGLLRGTAILEYELTVFNRWGTVVFRTNDYLHRWDGTNGSKKQPMGTYPWILRYKNKRGLMQSVKGTVLLIR